MKPLSPLSVPLFQLCQNQTSRERVHERVVTATSGPALLPFPVPHLHSQPRPRSPPGFFACSHVYGGGDDGRATPGQAGYRETEEEREEAEEDEVRSRGHVDLQTLFYANIISNGSIYASYEPLQILKAGLKGRWWLWNISWPYIFSLPHYFSL